MSNRLDSLQSKGTKPALKFKPKAVSRKSKEDREKDAPVTKTEEKPRATTTRGKGSVRGGRNDKGAMLAGTHLVSAGPLSMGSVTLEELSQPRTASRSHGTFNPQEDLGSTAMLARMTLKSRNLSLVDVDSDEEDHKASRINMSKIYAYKDSETSLFPVRPCKESDPTSDGALIASESALVPPSTAPSRAQTVDSVKSEQTDEVAPDLPRIADIAGDLASAEHDRLINDQLSIIDLLSTKLNNVDTEDEAQPKQQNYLLFQTPQIILEPCENESASAESKSPFANKNALAFGGRVGNLNFHKSGKVSITMNDGSMLECMKGTTPAFLHEVYVLDSFAAAKSPEELENDNTVYNAGNVKVGGDIYRMGAVLAKIVAKPII